MKRLGVMMAVVAGAMLLGACDHQENVPNYDPKVDSVLPQVQGSPDLSILDNQKKRYDNMVAANGGGGGDIKPAPATGPATSTAPATPDVLTSPEGGGTTTAPAGGGGEGATPAPPKE